MKKLWILKMAAMAILFVGLIGFILMQLWNWLMPELFGLPVITFWQSVGLFAIAKILFGFNKGKGHHHAGPPWKRHLQEKWGNMSNEEREQWKQKFASKWCPKATNENTTEDRKENS